MVWEALKQGTGKVAGFNHWPNPVDAIVDLRVLMCNRDYFLAEIEFLVGSVANLFWTQFLPSPREIERKGLMGSYKCGFFGTDGFRAPVEYIWGRDVQKALVEITNPFVTGLMYMWAMEVSIDALAIWQTVAFKKALCLPFVGNFLRQGDHALLSSGHSEGGIGLGLLKYDPNHYGNAFTGDMLVPPGWTRMNVFWTFDASGPAMTNLKTGFQVDSTVVQIQEHGSLPTGGFKSISRDFELTDTGSGHDIIPWFSADVALGGGLCTVSSVRTIGDHQNVRPPNPPSETHINNRHRHPKCAVQHF